MRANGWRLASGSALLAILLALIILLADFSADLQRVVFTLLLCLDGLSNLIMLVYGRLLRKAQVRAVAIRDEQEEDA